MSQPLPSWTPLAERLASLPLILAGPILRRVEPRSVTVWVALREARQVTLHVYRWEEVARAATERLLGSRRTVRLGDRLHVVAVTARAPALSAALDPNDVYCYDLAFTEALGVGDGPVADLRSPGVLVPDPAVAPEVERLVYGGLPLPSFVLPAPTLERVRLFHGSCRHPAGVGTDALATLDLVLSSSARDPLSRPQQLYQIGRAHV